MFSAQMIPMAEATCASMSLPVTSPIAQMPGTLGIGAESDRDEHLLGLQGLSTRLAGDLHLNLGLEGLHRLHPRTGQHLDAALAEFFGQLLADLLVFQRGDARQHLYQRDR